MNDLNDFITYYKCFPHIFESIWVQTNPKSVGAHSSSASQLTHLCTYTCYIECISAFTLKKKKKYSKCSALRAPGWCTRNSPYAECAKAAILAT